MQEEQNKLSPEEESKDRYFKRISELSVEMIDEHGKDFTMGALVMAAQWIARGETKATTENRH
jgi:hypothetical protein